MNATHEQATQTATDVIDMLDRTMAEVVCLDISRQQSSYIMSMLGDAIRKLEALRTSDDSRRSATNR